jgi:LysM repeat protein
MAIVVPVISEWSPKGLNSAIADITKAKGALGGISGTSAQATGGFDNMGKSLKKLGGVIAGAFATVQITNFFKESIQGAIADQKAQTLLATTLRNTTKATDAQIAGVEKYVDVLQRASGVADDQLRPSLSRLLTTTGDVSKAQELQKLALDVSAGSGKDLGSVTDALAKAYQGNFTALKRLGVPIDENIIKTKDYNGLVKTLSDTFKGQADAAANTYQGRLDRLAIAFNEIKETVGNAFLPIITNAMRFLIDKAVPAIEKLIDGAINLGKSFDPTIKTLREKLIPVFEFWYNFITQVVVPGIKKTFTPILNGLKDAFGIVAEAIDRNRDKLQPLFEFLVKLGNFIYTSLAPLIGQILGGAFRTLGKIIGATIDFVAKAIPGLVGFLEKAVNQAIRVVNFFIDTYNKLPNALKVFGELDRLAELTFPKFESTGVKAFEEVGDATVNASNVMSPALEGIDGNITKAAEKMKKAEDAAKKLKEEAIKVAEVLVSKLKDSLDKANNSLDDAKGKFKDFKDAITGTITGIIDFSKAAEKENFLEGLVEQANNAKVFADKVKKLVQIGLSERAIQLVLNAGYEAGSLIADQIIAGGNSIVNQVNELVASVATVADQVGEAGADLFYGEGVRQAQSLVNGIQAELDRAQISLDNIKLSGAPGGGGGGTTTAGAPSSSTYVVKPGDSLSNIAKKNNTTLQDILNANPKFTDQAKYNGGSTIFSGTTVKIPRKAMGGLVSGRMPYIVGENGPELFMPNVNGSVTPNNESRNISGGVYNITINAGIGADGTIIGRQIVEAITKYERNSGAVFVRQ